VAKLNEIKAACANVKVKPGNTDGLCAFLKKEIASSNINISMAAIGAATGLANGLTKEFAAGLKILLTPIFLKYKEKRPIVQEEVNKFADSVLKC